MGMDLAPVSGYILELTEENFQQLEIDLGEYTSLIEEFEVEGESRLETLCRLFNAYPSIETQVAVMGVTCTPTMMFYTKDDGGLYDDLSDGLYLLFEENDLFINTLTHLGTILEEKGMLPQYKRWTHFG